MRSALLIYVLLVSRTLIVMGFPADTDTNDKVSLEENSIVGGSVNDTDASVKFYTCVHIPPKLKNCDFPSYRITTNNYWLSGNGRMGRKKRELLSDNKENSPKKPLETAERFPRQRLGKIIIYEIQRCVPHRLPFALPWCTKEDLADKQSEIFRLIPFLRNGTSTKSLLDYNI